MGGCGERKVRRRSSQFGSQLGKREANGAITEKEREGGREGREEGRRGGKTRRTYLVHAVEPLHKDGGAFSRRMPVLVEAASTGEVVPEGDPVLVDQGLREGGREGGREGVSYQTHSTHSVFPPSLLPFLPPCLPTSFIPSLLDLKSA